MFLHQSRSHNTLKLWTHAAAVTLGCYKHSKTPLVRQSYEALSTGVYCKLWKTSSMFHHLFTWWQVTYLTLSFPNNLSAKTQTDAMSAITTLHFPTAVAVIIFISPEVNFHSSCISVGATFKVRSHFRGKNMNELHGDNGCRDTRAVCFEI